MKNSLKAKLITSCDTCGCKVRRTKTIKVVATNKEDAIVEARQKVGAWKASMRGTNCAGCKMVLASIERDIERDKAMA